MNDRRLTFRLREWRRALPASSIRRLLPAAIAHLDTDGRVTSPEVFLAEASGWAIAFARPASR